LSFAFFMSTVSTSRSRINCSNVSGNGCATTDRPADALAANPASSDANGCRSALVEHSKQVVSDTYFCDCCPVLLSSSSAQPWVSRASTEFTTSISFRSRRDGSLYGGSPTW
jgi:hypothetical protein